MKTNNLIQYSENKASQNDIFEHLKWCNEQFIPKLSEKVTILDYSKKIFEKAICFEAFDNQVLVGLVAAYNNTENNFLFITNVSVIKQNIGQGIAKQLIKNSIDFAQKNNINSIQLEVDKNNSKAIQLYEKMNFSLENENEQSLFLNYKNK